MLRARPNSAYNVKKEGVKGGQTKPYKLVRYPRRGITRNVRTYYLCGKFKFYELSKLKVFVKLRTR